WRGIVDQAMESFYDPSPLGDFYFIVFEFCRFIFDPGVYILPQDLRTNLPQGQEDDENHFSQVTTLKTKEPSHEIWKSIYLVGGFILHKDLKANLLQPRANDGNQVNQVVGSITRGRA